MYRIATTVRVGLLLGICLAVCAVTGFLSHLIQHPPEWFWWPTKPVWLYQVTQGAHVIFGVAAIPLLLVKLAVVYHKLWERPVIRSLAHGAERISIAVLVSATIFQLITGLFNTFQWYPWKFFFTTTHYAMAWIVVGAVLLHLAVKADLIGRVLRPRRTAAPPEPPPAETEDQPAVASRRSVLTGAVGLALAAVGAFWWWPRNRPISQHVPVNKTAARAGVIQAASASTFTLTVQAGGKSVRLTESELLALPRRAVDLPIACVEGWTAWANWEGIPVKELVALAGATELGDVRVTSFDRGQYGSSVLPRAHVASDDSLLALFINGERLSLDHGYPCRLIAPSRPGVTQTKWVHTVELL